MTGCVKLYHLFESGSNRVFLKHAKLAILASVKIKAGTYDFKSNTFLSELTWYLLVSPRLLDPYMVMLY